MAPSRRFVDSPPQAAADRQTACVLIGDGIGNLIEQAALVQAVATMYETVDVWCARSNATTASVLEGCPGAERILVGRKAAIRPGYSAAFVTTLMTKYWQRVAAAAKYRCRNFGNHGLSELECSVIAARKAGYTGDDPPAYCATSPVPLPADAPLLIGIGGGGKLTGAWRHKRYPHYDTVVSLLADQYPEAVFLVVGTGEDAAITHPQAIDLRDALSPPQTAYVLQHCQLVIANDCAAAHMADAVGTPCVVVFGPTSVTKNLPTRQAVPVHASGLTCQPCQFSRSGIARVPGTKRLCDHACMQQLLPSMIVETACEVLQCQPIPHSL